MDQASLRWLMAGIIFICGLTGGLLALMAKKTTRAEAIFSLGAAMAGGIFLGAGLIHLLPDAMDGFGGQWPKMSYPLASLLACLGLSGLLMLEGVLLPGMLSPAEAPAGRGVSPHTTFILAVALSIHSVLAGASLGAEDTLIGSLVILLAIVAHKSSAAFALAISLHKSGASSGRMMGMISLFSLTTPLGIGLGAGFSALMSDAGAEIFEAVFDSLAAGTFIYIALLDIVEEEFSDLTRKWPKMGLFGGGLGLMAVLALWL